MVSCNTSYEQTVDSYDSKMTHIISIDWLESKRVSLSF